MFFGFGPLYTFLIILGVLLVIGIKKLKEYERAVVFRLGKIMGTVGPGMIYVTPLIDRMVRVDLNKLLPGWQGLPKDELNQRVQALVSKTPLEYIPQHATPAVPSLTTAQRIAGIILIVNGILVFTESAVMPSPDSTFNPISAAIIDLLLGVMLVAGRTRVLGWVKFRVVAGAVVFTALYAVNGNLVMAAIQLLFSGALSGLLFGDPGKLRFSVSLVAVLALFALDLVGLLAEFTGKNLLTPIVVSFTEDLQPVEGGTVRSVSFPYQITVPSERWLLRSAEAARADNPLADTWLMNPDYDAHILVIAESLNTPVTLAVEQLAEVVIRTASEAAADFQVLANGLVESRSGKGKLIDATGVIDGLSIHFHYGVFSFEGYAFQVVCFANSKSFEHVASDFRSAIESFLFTQ